MHRIIIGVIEKTKEISISKSPRRSRNKSNSASPDTETFLCIALNCSLLDQTFRKYFENEIYVKTRTSDATLFYKCVETRVI